MGATSLGFSTMVQPAASAGATLQAIWFSGQFQGVISPTTPIPSRTTRVPLRCSSNANASSALMVDARWACPAAAWELRARPIGAPISSDTARAISSMRSL
jgi:hypothetical protein